MRGLLRKSNFIKLVALVFAVAFTVMFPMVTGRAYADAEELTLSKTNDETKWASDALEFVSLTLGRPKGESGTSLLFGTDERNDSGFVYLGSRSGFSPVADASAFNSEKLCLDFWLYVNNAELAKKAYVRFELTSAGGKQNPADNEEKQQVLFNNGVETVTGIIDGWNHIVCNLSDGRISFERINYFRFFIANLQRNAGKVTFALHHLKLTETELGRGEAKVIETQNVDTPYEPMVVKPIDENNPPQDNGVVFASAKSSLKWMDNVSGAYDLAEEWTEGCVLAAGSGGMVVACTSDGVNLEEHSVRQDYAYVSFWIYSNDFSVFTKTGQFELNSSRSGTFDDNNEIKWDWTDEFASSFEDGKWNKVELKLPSSAGAHLTGTVDLNNLRYFRIWNFPANGSYGFEALMLFSDIVITEKDYNPEDWDGSLMRVAETKDASIERIDKTNLKHEIFDTPYNAVNTGIKKGNDVEPQIINKEEVKNPSNVANVLIIVFSGILAAYGLFAVVFNAKRIKNERK